MMHHGHLTPFWTAVLAACAVVTFVPWGRLRELRDALREVLRRTPRSPGPAHPSARALQQPKAVISEDEAEALWREFYEPRGIPGPTDGSDR